MDRYTNSFPNPIFLPKIDCMKLNKAVILAGGKGTRLSSVIKDIPKPMAEVAGKPFLEYLMDMLYNYGFKEVVLSVGYKKEVIITHFGDVYRGIKIRYAIEQEPLGTGGAIQHAGEYFGIEPYFVFNGDTLFYADLQEMERIWNSHSADMVMAVKPLDNVSRYGSLNIKEDRILSFKEKNQLKAKGVINGGIYLMDNSLFGITDLPRIFSFEKDILESHIQNMNVMAVSTSSYFIDIGIPDDYEKAQSDFGIQSITDLRKRVLQGGWTLFLDRDGVINQRIPGNYVKYVKEFLFIPDSDKAVAQLSPFFDQTVLVTNQQGVGKNLVRAQLLNDVHQHMCDCIAELGGKIDKCYYAPGLSKLDPKTRKPNIGMGLDAQRDFPKIDFSKSIIVGDSVSDIQFGKRLGMFSVFLETKTVEEVELAKHEDIDLQFKDLYAFAKAFCKNVD